MKIQSAKKSARAGRVIPCAPSSGGARLLTSRLAGTPAPPRRGGFTLLEVMFAVIAFCTATFAILALVSQSLETGRRLQRPMVDSGLVASELSLTNKLVEGTESGDLGDLLGNEYKGYTYDYAVDEAQTNKLFQMVIALQSNQGGKPVVSKMTVLFYRPDSPAGTLDGGNFTHP
jgi:hypothetical protein